MASYEESSQAVTPGDQGAQGNKICQWYCCSCGKSYGTIMYKQVEDLEREALMTNLKYYSQLTYSNVNEDRSEWWSEGDTGYKYEAGDSERRYNARLSMMSSLTSPLTSISSYEAPGITDGRCQTNPNGREEEYHQHHQHHNHHNYHDNNQHNHHDNSYNSKDTVILDVPTRFTCSRCNHMMCPYCLKTRYKDLH
ncbi:uncharacterized protein PRCAT00002300001 [Priceomyces carsonii]|uniref:uncharacterized protein n=1 Tax=Priceomyces carsonii TaxID=28549 RepID=UPI002EDA46F2|nr:unnamed protein product [Priceomyces carsonii]